MGSYNIYLGDPHGVEYDWKSLEIAVAELFAPAIAGSRRYSKIQAHRTRVAPTLA